MTPTAVSAQPAEKAVDSDKGTTDPLLLRAARGEVQCKLAQLRRKMVLDHACLGAPQTRGTTPYMSASNRF